MSLLLFLTPAIFLLLAQNDTAEQARHQFIADDVRFNDINVRRMRGIQPAPEENAFIQGFNSRRGAINAEFKKTQASHDSVGIVPLNDLGTGAYKGEQGGL